MTAWLFLTMLVVVLPVLAHRSNVVLVREQPEIAPGLVYLQIVAFQAVVAGIAIATWWREGLRIIVTGSVTATGLAMAAATVLLFLVLAVLVRRASPERNPVVDLLRPRTGRDRVFWSGAMLAAAVGEELVYRGALFTLLAGWFDGRALPAALLAALAFGLGHLAQGWRGLLFSTLMALAMQALVAVSGGLLLAMLAHLGYDVLVQLLPEDDRVRIPDHRAEAPDPDGGAVRSPGPGGPAQ